MSRVAFILGAGFSCCAGLPVMSVFLDSTNQELDRLTGVAVQSIKGHAAKGAAGFVEAGRLYLDFVDFCRKAADNTSFNASNLEEVFCVAESLRESNLPLSGGDRKIQLRCGEVGIDYVLDRIKEWLWKMYQQLPAVGHGSKAFRDERSEPYRRFMKTIQDSGAGTRMGILTTNYDMVIETFAMISGMSIRYPVFATAELQTQDPYTPFSKIQPLIPLCKLHGSVNFFEINTPDVKRVFGFDEGDFGTDMEMARPGSVIGGSLMSIERPAILALGRLAALRQKYGFGLVPAIVPPTYSKLESRPWLRAMWSEAVDHLGEADSLIIIGYSMPASDGFMRAMLHAAMALRRKNEKLRVLIVDPCQEAIDRLSNFFEATGRVTSRKKKFEVFMNEEQETLAQWLS